MAATVVVLGFFAVDTLRNAPETFAAIVAIAALAVILDAVWKQIRKESPPTVSRLNAGEKSAELHNQGPEEES